MDKVSGDLDVRRMLTDIDKLFRKLGTSGRLPQGSSPPRISQRTMDQVDEAVKDAKLEVQVGKDHILRRSSFNVNFELPDDLRRRARGLEGGEVKFHSDQTNVNGNQQVTPPTNARPLSELLGGFGLRSPAPG